MKTAHVSPALDEKLVPWAHLAAREAEEYGREGRKKKTYSGMLAVSLAAQKSFPLQL